MEYAKETRDAYGSVELRVVGTLSASFALATGCCPCDLRMLTRVSSFSSIWAVLAGGRPPLRLRVVCGGSHALLSRWHLWHGAAGDVALRLHLHLALAQPAQACPYGRACRWTGAALATASVAAFAVAGPSLPRSNMALHVRSSQPIDQNQRGIRKLSCRHQLLTRR